MGEAGELDHGRRAAHEHEALLMRAWQPLCDHCVRDETRGEAPLGGRAVQRVPDLEALGVLGGVPGKCRAGSGRGGAVSSGFEVWQLDVWYLEVWWL